MEEYWLKQLVPPEQKYVCPSGVFEGVTMIVDGTECPVDPPGIKEEKLEFVSGRNKDNTHGQCNWKYTLAVCPLNGKIIHILGPIPGRVSDIAHLRQEEHQLQLEEGEILLADKGT